MRPRSSGSSSSRPVSAGSVGSTGSGSELQFPLLQQPNLPPVPPSLGPIQVITVVKDSSGYGMKVSGDNPVFVQSVKADGASERAGLRQGDRILRVNGVDVTHSTHVEVVELIRGELYACNAQVS
ncbi:hypothetical protein B566_EDAN017678 [Ephemera danica]|nr:hypothetical protein B566_EDAN017678 [Ephemera danica]